MKHGDPEPVVNALLLGDGKTGVVWWRGPDKPEPEFEPCECEALCSCDQRRE